MIFARKNLTTIFSKRDISPHCRFLRVWSSFAPLLPSLPFPSFILSARTQRERERKWNRPIYTFCVNREQVKRRHHELLFGMWQHAVSQGGPQEQSIAFGLQKLSVGDHRRQQLYIHQRFKDRYGGGCTLLIDFFFFFFLFFFLFGFFAPFCSSLTDQTHLGRRKLSCFIANVVSLCVYICVCVNLCLCVCVFCRVKFSLVMDELCAAVDPRVLWTVQHAWDDDRVAWM